MCMYILYISVPLFCYGRPGVLLSRGGSIYTTWVIMSLTVHERLLYDDFLYQLQRIFIYIYTYVSDDVEITTSFGHDLILIERLLQESSPN